MLQPGVGDLQVLDIEVLELPQVAQVNHAGIGNIGIDTKLQSLNLWRVFKVGQTGIGDSFETIKLH